jgi:sec-independent protein translocase protein TatA
MKEWSMTGFISPVHVVFLLVVLLLVFGAKRLPEFGRSLGSGMREFKASLNPEPGDERATLPTQAAPGAPGQPATAAQLGPPLAAVEAQPLPDPEPNRTS